MDEMYGSWVTSRSMTVHWHAWRPVPGTDRGYYAPLSRCGMNQEAGFASAVRQGATAEGAPIGSCATCRRLLIKDAERRARAGVMEAMWAQTAGAMAAHEDARIMGELVPEAREDLDAQVCRELGALRRSARTAAFLEAGWVPLALHEAVVQGAFQRGREALLTEALAVLQKRAEAYRVLGKFGPADVVGEAMDRLAALVVGP